MGEAAGPERMSDLEAMMWRIGTDPHLSSTFAAVTFFDRSPDIDRLRRRVWRASRMVPQLRRRVAPGLGPTPPTWEEDPAFDLDHHLREVTLPAGAGEAEVRELAVRAAGLPFDASRPLWEFTVVHGLPDGRAAMIQKLHHTVTDGEGGIRLSIEYVDLERDAPEPPPVDDGPPAARRTSGPVGLLGALPGVLGHAARAGADRTRRVLEGAVDLAREPGQIAATVASLPADTAATVQSVVRQFGVVDGHRSPLWTERSLFRRLETFDVPLDDVKLAAKALGGSVNDLFVAAAAGGAGRYHRARGSDVGELRMSMPVSTRTTKAPGGNAFTPTRVLVPTDADPRTRFDEIHRRLSVTKTERALGLTASLAGLTNLVPRPVLVRIARQQVMTVDFTTSNVRAAPFDLYVAGALIEANYPVGPVAGTAWNLTTMSYRGLLNSGLHADTAAVEDPAALARDVRDSFEELLELGRPRARRSRKSGSGNRRRT